MDWTWAIGGITDEVPRTAGPDCINYMTNQRRIVEAIFVSIVCLWVTHWSCKRMDPIEVPAGPPQPHSPMRLFLLILMCFIFGVEMGFKLAGESVIFVLNPCHIQTIIQIYLLAAKPSKLTIALFRIQLNYANGPFLASLFPEVESRTYAFERCTYWIQHALLYFIPVYMLRSGAYKAEKLKDFYWVAIGVSIMFLYHFTFLTYISVIKVYKTARTVPKELENVMDAETFHKARLYGLDQEQFGIFKAILMDVTVVSLILYFGIIAYLWKKAELLAVQLYLDESSEIIVSCLFLFELSCISIVMDMPFEVYGTFVLEEKHGFNKQSAKIFIIDQIEGFVATQVISVPIVAAVVFIVQHGGEHFFIWLWLCNGIVSLVLLTIHPIFIAPLFDDYTPLEDGTLRESIENLAASLEFPLTKVYVVDGSKRSAHSNAYFYGLWGSKRIVLFDTLLLNNGKKDESELKEEERGKGCTDEEVLAVLAHELGHWKLGHVTKNIIIIQVHLLLIFAAFGYLFQYGPFYEAVGFESGQRPILVGLLVVVSYVMLPYIALINFGMKMLSRKFEYEADEFAQKLGFADLLSKALIKLNIDNLEFPVYDWLYSSWNHSHPTLLQRLDRLKEIERQ